MSKKPSDLSKSIFHAQSQWKMHEQLKVNGSGLAVILLHICDRMTQVGMRVCMPVCVNVMTEILKDIQLKLFMVKFCMCCLWQPELWILKTVNFNKIM